MATRKDSTRVDFVLPTAGGYSGEFMSNGKLSFIAGAKALEDMGLDTLGSDLPIPLPGNSLCHFCRVEVDPRDATEGMSKPRFTRTFEPFHVEPPNFEVESKLIVTSNKVVACRGCASLLVKAGFTVKYPTTD